MTIITREIDIETAIEDMTCMAAIAMNLFEDLENQRRAYAEDRELIVVTPAQMEENLKPLHTVFGYTIYQLVMMTREVRDAYQSEVKAAA